jgi:hypothetical protein
VYRLRATLPVVTAEDGSPILPAFVLWAFSLNEGDLLAVSPGEDPVKPLVLFAGLPIVLRKLRGTRSVKEVAAGAGLAKERLALLEHRPSRRYGKRMLQELAGKTPRLDTLDSLLRFYGVSLAELEALLQEAQGGGGRGSPGQKTFPPAQKTFRGRN